MRLRQKQQNRVLLVMQQFGHIVGQIERGRAIVLMRHLHALRRGRRSGSVHDGAQVGLLHSGDAGVELFVTHSRTVRLDFLKSSGFEADDMFQGRAFGLGAIRLLLHVRGLHDQQTRVGVVDDVADLLGGIGVVNGGEHSAAGHDGRIEHIPGVGGAAHECHAVALLQSVVQQTLRDGTDVGERLVGGLRDPIAILLVGVQRLIAHALGAIGVDVVDGGAFIERRVAFGLRGQQTGFRVEERGGRVTRTPFGGMRQFDMAVGGEDVVRIVVIRCVSGIVADRVHEIVSQAQCLLREIGGLFVQRGDDGHVTLLHI